MKEIFKKLSKLIATEYLVYLVRYSSRFKLYGFSPYGVKIKKGILPFLYGFLFGKKKREEIERVICRGTEVNGALFLSIDPIGDMERMLDNILLLRRQTAKEILRWVFFGHVFFPGEANESWRQEIVAVFKECVVHLHITDINEFFDKLLQKCRKFHLHKESWLYSSIGDPLICVLENLAYISFRKDKLEEIADFMVAREENHFPDWHIIASFYYRSGTKAAAEKMLKYGNLIFTEQWNNEDEWGTFGPYTRTLSEELEIVLRQREKKWETTPFVN